jgi:lipopolysaccharide/colanic/teichoic acid biosynthesis glycosyltransferase
MSLVGPRPDVVPYEEYNSRHRRRFEAVPGMTGLWQVTGKNRTTFSEMVGLDIEYVERRSFWLDTKIVLMTMPAIIRQLNEDREN